MNEAFNQPQRERGKIPIDPIIQGITRVQLKKGKGYFYDGI